MFYFIFERERKRERAGGGADRIRNRLQALSCQHRAWCGAQTHKPWDHDLSQSQMLNRLSHPGALRFISSFPHLMPFISFPFPIALAKTFSTVLNRSGRSEHFVLFVVLGGHFHSFTMECDISCGFFINAHFQVGEIPLFLIFFNVYLFLRERAWAGEGQRKRGQRIQSRLCADSSEPNVGLELTNCEIMTWAEVGCSTDWAQPRCPREIPF